MTEDEVKMYELVEAQCEMDESWDAVTKYAASALFQVLRDPERIKELRKVYIRSEKDDFLNTFISHAGLDQDLASVVYDMFCSGKL